MRTLLAILLSVYSLSAQTLTPVNIGTTANDGTGDSVRAAFNKVNNNFSLLSTNAVRYLYGAVGNGVADDTFHIQSVLNQMTNGILRIPRGVFRITSTITLPRWVSIEGEGLTSDYSSSYRGPTVLLKDGNFDALIPGIESAVRNIQIDGAPGNGGDGIYVCNSHVRLEGVTVVNQGGCGIRIGGKTIGHNADHGFFSCLHLVANSGHGMYVCDTDTNNINANACIFQQLDVRANLGDGIRVENAIDNQWHGITTQINGGAGIHLTNGASGQEFFFPYTEADTNGTVVLGANATMNVIFGTRQGVPDQIQDLNFPNSHNTVVGRDFSKDGMLNWRALMAWQVLLSKSPYLGQLSFSQIGDDTYEARNIHGNSSFTLRLRSDGTPGIGILDANRLVINTNALTVNGNGFVGIGTTNANSEVEINGRFSGSPTVVVGGPETDISGSTLYVKNGLGRLHVLPFEADNISLTFDGWFTNGVWKSAMSGANGQILKSANKLQFRFSSANATNSSITWTNAFEVDLVTGVLKLPLLAPFANNAAAISGGLSAGQLYRTGGNPDAVCVVH